MDKLDESSSDRTRDFWKRLREVEEELFVRMPFLPFHPSGDLKARLRLRWTGRQIEALTLVDPPTPSVGELHTALDELLGIEKIARVALKMPAQPAVAPKTP